MEEEWTTQTNGKGSFDGLCQIERCGFTTKEWPTEDLAEKRIKEHIQEHKTSKPMRELEEFRQENKVTF